MEKRTPGGEWERVNHVPIKDSHCTVPDLKEGEDYEFRVRGVNPAGEGEPSLNTAPVTCKDKKSQSLFLVYVFIYFKKLLFFLCFFWVFFFFFFFGCFFFFFFFSVLLNYIEIFLYVFEWKCC